MRVAFMGSPDFAVPALRAVTERHEVVAVYTQPDRPRGRGRAPVPTAIKVAALELDIPVYQPPTLRDPEVVREFQELDLDVACVAAYGLILPVEILSAPLHGCINVHASLLPRHRGAAPIHRAILEGDDRAGVCIMQMEQGLDTGPYAICVSTPVDDKSLGEIEAELADSGAAALLTTLDSLAAGTIDWVAQDDSQATYAAKITAADVRLTPDLTVVDALRRIRASTRSARAKVRIDGCILDITLASVATEHAPQGSISGDKASLRLGFADGAVSVLSVRPEGKGLMDGCAWARGARIDMTGLWEAV